MIPALEERIPAATSRRRFELVDAWIFAEGPDPRWRVDGLLYEQGLAMIYGASGSGKSFLALDLAMAIARGVPFGFDQRSVIPGRVVYIVAEGAGGFRKRLRAYRDAQQLQSNLRELRLINGAPNLMDSADGRALQAEILANGGADVIIVDTLHASSAGADENSTKDMGQVIAVCKALQAATASLVVLVHHSGKDPSRGARGSSCLRADIDTEIEIREEKDFRVALVTKQRDGEGGARLHFQLRAQGYSGGSSAVVEHIDATKEAGKSQRKPRTSDAKTGIIATVARLSPGYEAGVPIDIVTNEYVRAQPSAKRYSVERSIERLVGAGELQREGDLLQVTSEFTGNSTGIAPVPTEPQIFSTDAHPPLEGVVYRWNLGCS